MRTAKAKRRRRRANSEILGEVAAKLDESEARQAFVAMDTELAGVPLPSRDITEEMLAGLRSTVSSVQDELRDIMASSRKNVVLLSMSADRVVRRHERPEA